MALVLETLTWLLGQASPADVSQAVAKQVWIVVLFVVVEKDRLGRGPGGWGRPGIRKSIAVLLSRSRSTILPEAESTISELDSWKA